MRFTIEMVVDKLSVNHQLRKYGHSCDVTFQEPRLFDDNVNAAPETLLVADTAHLPLIPQIPENSLLICAGRTENLHYHNNRFCFVEVPDIALSRLFGEIQDICALYNTWETDANAIIFKDADIDALLQTALCVMENPIFVCDSSFKYIGRALATDKSRPYISDVNFSAGSTSEPVAVRHVMDVSARIAKYGYDIKPRLCNDYKNLVYNIDLFSGKLHIGQLSLVASDRPFRDSDPQLLEILARQVERAYQIRSTILQNQTENLKTIVSDLLNGKPIDHKKIDALITGPALPTDKRFAFLCLHDTRKAFAQKFLVATMEQRIPGCLTLLHQNRICCIVDFCACPDSDEVLTEKLFSYANDFSVLFGISRRFRLLEEVANAFLQASAAVDILVQYRPEDKVLYFEECALDYMLLHSLGDFNAMLLAPEGFQELVEYSRNSSEDYLKLLQVYFENDCNASESARVLYMHRTTFLKRMDRIKKFLGEDFESSDQFFRLQLCMKILSRFS